MQTQTPTINAEHLMELQQEMEELELYMRQAKTYYIEGVYASRNFQKTECYKVAKAIH